MNRSIKSLILAAGVAVATLTVAVPAHADPNGPGTFELGPVEPTQPPLPVPPQPKPQPAVDGPDEIAQPPHCTHGCGDDQGPDGPKDIAPAPAEEEVINGGPLEAADPKDDPAHDAPLDQGCFTGCDLPEEPAVDEAPVTTPAGAVLDSNVPSTVSDFDADELPAAQAEDNGGLDLLWILVGGAGAGALVLAAVARRRRQQAEQAA